MRKLLPFPSMKSRRLAWAAGLFLVLAPLSLVWTGMESEAASDFRLFRVQKKAIAQTIMLSGRVFPEKAMVITAQHSGRILSLNVKEGSQVETNAPLFTMSLEASSQAELMTLRSQVGILEHESVSAAQRLHKRKAVQDLIGVEQIAREGSEVKRLELELAAARERLKLMEGSLGPASDKPGESSRQVVVRSPIKGIVTLVDKRPGDFILGGGGLSPGSADLGGGNERMAMIVADMSQLQVRIKVLEADLRYMQKGLPVEVRLDAYPENTYRGELVQVGGQGRIDPGSGNTYFDVFVAIHEADAQLLPEMNATVELMIARKDEALTLPVSCVLILPHQSLVRVPSPKAPGYTYVPVQTGIINATEVEITAGLQEGSEVLAMDFADPQIKEWSMGLAALPGQVHE